MQFKYTSPSQYSKRYLPQQRQYKTRALSEIDNSHKYGIKSSQKIKNQSEEKINDIKKKYSNAFNKKTQLIENGENSFTKNSDVGRYEPKSSITEKFYSKYSSKIPFESPSRRNYENDREAKTFNEKQKLREVGQSRQQLKSMKDDLYSKLKEINTRNQTKEVKNVSKNQIQRRSHLPKTDHKNDLSTISEVSNSNNSENVQEKSAQFQEKMNKGTQRRKTFDQALTKQDQIMIPVTIRHAQIQPSYEKLNKKSSFDQNFSERFLKDKDNSVPCYEIEKSKIPQGQYTFKRNQKRMNDLSRANELTIKKSQTRDYQLDQNKNRSASSYEYSYSNSKKSYIEKYEKHNQQAKSVYNSKDYKAQQQTSFQKENQRLKEQIRQLKDKVQTKEKPQGEDLNNRIKKINDKIRQYEINKKDLSLPTKNKQLSKGTNVDNEYQNIYQKYNITNTNSHKKKPFDNVVPIYSEKTLPHGSKYGKVSPFSLNLVPVEMQGDKKYQKTDYAKKDKFFIESKYKNLYKQKIQTNNGILQRKKKLFEEVEQNNKIKKLVKAFTDQAELDEQYRNNKIWLGGSKSFSNMKGLKDKLKSYGLIMTEQEIKEEFSLSETQNNPFFSISQCKCSLDSLVKSFLKSKKHWQNSIMNQFRKQDLLKEGLSLTKLDLEHKGYIEVEDFVRFINIESGTFLRNRDVALIFKKLKRGNQKLYFEEMFITITEK